MCLCYSLPLILRLGSETNEELMRMRAIYERRCEAIVCSAGSQWHNVCGFILFHVFDSRTGFYSVSYLRCAEHWAFLVVFFPLFISLSFLLSFSIFMDWGLMGDSQGARGRGNGNGSGIGTAKRETAGVGFCSYLLVFSVLDASD